MLGGKVKKGGDELFVGRSDMGDEVDVNVDVGLLPTNLILTFKIFRVDLSRRQRIFWLCSFIYFLPFFSITSYDNALPYHERVEIEKIFQVGTDGRSMRSILSLASS